MSLYRQLIIFTFLLFGILLTGTWLTTFENNRSFLTEQLSSHAQDSATSLALAISQRSLEKDKIGMEGMISAVFDRGYYEAIRALDLNGNVLIERKLDLVIDGVPRWFIRLVPLPAPEAASFIMAGWRQSGVIHVKSHPGYAYKALWQNTIRISAWLLACGIFVLVSGAWGLRLLLRPLNHIKTQADAICRKEYAFQEPPRTKELRTVVAAMNHMVDKVKTMFAEQVAIAEAFRKEAYEDMLTGLGNRRYFESRMQTYLEQRERPISGILFLIQLNHLQEVNCKIGFEAGDVLIKDTAATLQKIVKNYPEHVLARLTGGDFVFLLPDSAPWEAETISANIISDLCGLRSSEMKDVAHAGVVTFDASMTLSFLLSEADRALRIAQQKAPNSGHVLALSADENGKRPAGQEQWKAALEQALQEHKIALDAQPVLRTTDTGEVLHLEILSRVIYSDGQVLNADLFLPYAERLELMPLWDRIVVEEVLKLNRDSLQIKRLAVNISVASLYDSSFMKWIYKTLQDQGENAPRLTFEFTEYAAIHHLGLIKEFQTFVKGCGHDIALDHFGQSFSNFGYLRSLLPEYVKLDRSYTRNIADAESDTRFFITALCNIAHSIDIAVIAGGLEKEEDCTHLKALNVDAIQGFSVRKPKPVLLYLRKD